MEKNTKWAVFFLEQTEIPQERIDDYPDTLAADSSRKSKSPKPSRRAQKILLLDEPTTGLDLFVQAKILDLIKALQKRLCDDCGKPRFRRD